MSAPESPASAAYEFPSLGPLKAAHLKLLAAESAATGADESAPVRDPSFLEDVRTFMQRASATGRVLDDDGERGAAQTILNYWATVLFRAGADSVPKTALLEWEETAGRELDESQCPYLGLQAFSEGQAHLFFGRKGVPEKWAKTLLTKRLLVIFGSSGSGKTSLLQAGLLPLLRAREAQTRRILSMIEPGSTPLAALVRAFGQTDAELSRWVASLEHEPASIVELAGTQPVLLIVNGLEDLYLRCEQKAQHHFLEVLLALTREAAAEHRVVAVCRLDLASKVTPWLEQNAPGFGESAFVPPFTARELREAIADPANRIGLRFEEGLVETLVNEFLGEPAALTLLQFTLLALWDARARNHITWEAYRHLGGAQGAVEKVAEKVFAELAPREQAAVPQIFLALVNPGPHRELICEVLPIDQLPRGELTPGEMEALLGRWEKARLLRVSKDAAGRRVAGVTHEALLRKWPRLMDWIDDARLVMRERQRVAVAEAQWRERGRPSEALLRGVVLDDALAIRPQLSPNEQEFVGISTRARSRSVWTWRATVAAALLFLSFVAWDKARKATEASKRQVAAEEAAVRETGLRTEAEALRKEEARLLAQMFGERAERLLELGDPAGALLWRTAAWEKDPKAAQSAGDEQRESSRLHALRVRGVWGMLPRLLETVPHKELARAVRSGHHLATTSREEGLLLWDLAAPREKGVRQHRRLIEGKRGASNGEDGDQINDAAFDPAGALLAAASGPRTGNRGRVEVWRCADGQLAAKQLALETGAALQVVFHPSGEHLLVSASREDGKKGVAFMWKHQTGEKDRTLEVEEELRWVSFHPDGELVALATGSTRPGAKNGAILWDWRADKVQLLPHEMPVNFVEFSADKKWVLTASGNPDHPKGEVRLWKVDDRSELPKALVHEGSVSRAHFSPDSLSVASASNDRTARIWDVATQREVLKLPHTADVSDVAFSPDGRFLATGGRERAARIWEIATGAPALPPLNDIDTVSRLEFSPDGRQLLTSSKNQARIWETTAAEPVAPQLDNPAPVIATAVSGDARRIATVEEGDEGRSVNVWDAATGRRVMKTFSLPPPAQAALVRLSVDGRRLLIAGAADPNDLVGNQSQLTILELPPAELPTGNLAERASFLLEGRIEQAEFSARGAQLGVLSSSGGKPGSVTVWEESTGKPAQLPTESTRHAGLDWSPGGNYLALRVDAGPKAGEAEVWRLRDAPAKSIAPTKVLVLTHREPITAVAFSPDEQLLLSGGIDDDVKVWAIPQLAALPPGKPILLRVPGKVSTHTADVTAVQFSPDGGLALTASRDQTVLLWDIAIDAETRGPQQLDPPIKLQHRGAIKGVAFSAGSDFLVTATAEPRLRLWSTGGALVGIFRPAGEVLRAAFAGDGHAIHKLRAVSQILHERSAEWKVGPATASGPTAFRRLLPQTWPLEPLPFTREQITAHGKLLAGRHLNEGLELETLAHEEVAQLARDDVTDAFYHPGKPAGER